MMFWPTATSRSGLKPAILAHEYYKVFFQLENSILYGQIGLIKLWFFFFQKKLDSKSLKFQFDLNPNPNTNDGHIIN